MLMGIGNLTELTEADSTGVTALLIGFCQEVGIGAVLTTEVIGWARGAVRETVLAAQIMHLAQRQARPPKHIDSGLVTSKDESMRAPTEEELRAMQAQISDANYRLFADADWLYAFNGDRFVREANMYAVFDQLDVDDAAHAFYLGKELMKATIARGLRKSYRQEGPLDWGLLSFPEPRREDIAMKKILIQLDTDPHPSAFDAIAAYDADVDVVIGYGEITADNLDDVVQGAIFPRGPDGLANTAFWVGGSKVRDGEAVFEAAQKLFFEPFNPSIMLDSDGSNTTAAAAVARVRGAVDAEGQPGRGDRRRAGRTAHGRAAAARGRRGDDVHVPARCDGGQASPRVGHPGRRRRPDSRSSSRSRVTSSTRRSPATRSCSPPGPAGTQILRRSGWAQEGVRWSSTTRRPSPSASRASTAATASRRKTASRSSARWRSAARR